MQNFNLSFKLAFLALALQLVSAGPLHESEDPIAVPTIQFRSKTDQDICSAYQIAGKMFITQSRCLGTDANQINQLTELEVLGLGQERIQAFALQSAGATSIGDLAVVVYSNFAEGGDYSQESGLFGKFGLRSLVRTGRARQDETPAAGAATDGAAFASVNAKLIGAALTFMGSVLLMH